MTCVVGLVDNGKVWIGADSLSADGYSMTIRRDPKVFRNGQMLFGFTSSWRMGQLLRFSLAIPAPSKGQDVDAYMATTFVNAVRECLRTGGYARKKDEVESAGTFLVGYEGRLMRVESDYQVGENVDPFDACGAGQDVALGAFYATAGLRRMTPRRRLLVALKAAQRFSAAVREPFLIKSLS